jgi:hypothetical protein
MKTGVVPMFRSFPQPMCVLTLCSFVGTRRRFGGTCYPHLQDEGFVAKYSLKSAIVL